jgi:hypothetical protein
MKPVEHVHGYLSLEFYFRQEAIAQAGSIANRIPLRFQLPLRPEGFAESLGDTSPQSTNQ